MKVVHVQLAHETVEVIVLEVRGQNVCLEARDISDDNHGPTFAPSTILCFAKLRRMEDVVELRQEAMSLPFSRNLVRFLFNTHLQGERAAEEAFGCSSGWTIWPPNYTNQL